MSIPDIGSDHCRVVPADDSASLIQQLQFYRHLFAYVEAARRLPPAARLLEIGSGEGYGAAHLAASAQSVIALDLSLTPLAHAAAHYPAVHFCCALADALSFPAASFEIVVSFQVIEHVPDVDAYLREIRRVLAPGGQLILTTPNRSLRLLPFQRPWNPYHLREFSARQLRRRLQNVFAAVDVFGVAARAEVLAMEKTRVRQRPARVYPVMLAQWLERRLGLPLSRLGQEPRPGLAPPSGEDAIPRHCPAHIELDDFFLSTTAETAMDLFAVARRSP